MPLLNEIIHTFLEASPYLLVGLAFAAVLQAFVSKEKISSWIGQRNARSVFIAAAAGVPISVCSCGVLPMAMSLYKNGASRGATIAFLISTPETGLDAIMLSLALLDPVMAIFRPIIALVTSIVAGIAENIFDQSKVVTPAPAAPKDCCSSQEKPHQHLSLVQRLVEGFRYSFVTLLGDIAPWLILGLVLSGIISYVVPSSMIEQFLGGGLSSMLLMLVIGMPMYICASASTPIAATLLLKGAAPGAVLVFLLAGPATNVTSMLMVNRFLGTRALIIYLTSIAVCAIAAGFLLNALYSYWHIDIRASVGHAAHCIDLTWQIVSAVVLVIAMIYALVKK